MPKNTAAVHRRMKGKQVSIRGKNAKIVSKTDRLDRAAWIEETAGQKKRNIQKKVIKKKKDVKRVVKKKKQKKEVRNNKTMLKRK